MKIERITYKKIFPLAPYINEQVGIEAILEDGDTPEQVLSSLKKVAEDWHKSTNPTLVIEAGQPILPVIKEDSKQGDDIIIGYINGCTSIDDKVSGLSTFHTMCKGNKALTQAYNKKLSQLQKPTNGKPAQLP